MTRTAHLLLVDDDPADLDILEDYLGEAPFRYRTDVANDGVEALELLRGGLRPDLIVLDLNMPRMDGFETLRSIRADPELHDLKVIVLTTSDQEEHIMASFDLEANSFVTKPSKPDQFLALLQLMDDFLHAYVWKDR